jgi:hypothetical protein
MPKKTVVIVGLGFAGMRAFRDLNGPFTVIAIDSKDFFEYTPAGPASLVDPEAAEKQWLVPYARNAALAKKFKQGVVVSIVSDGAAGEVTLASGEKVAFDFCVVAAGSTYEVYKADPAAASTKAERVARYGAHRDAISGAEGVVIVGGGTVGVETAAAIVEAFPGKPVTVVTAAARLLDRMNTKASDYAAAWLETKAPGAKVIYGERISGECAATCACSSAPPPSSIRCSDASACTRSGARRLGRRGEVPLGGHRRHRQGHRPDGPGHPLRGRAPRHRRLRRLPGRGRAGARRRAAGGAHPATQGHAQRVRCRRRGRHGGGGDRQHGRMLHGRPRITQASWRRPTSRCSPPAATPRRCRLSRQATLVATPSCP